jgi:triacylglycerol lipase
MMNSRHLVDPALLPLLDALPTIVVTAENLAERRASRMPLPIAEDDGVSIRKETVAGPTGAPDIDLYIMRPEKAVGPLPLIYHVHGGGYIVGSVPTFEGMLRAVVADVGCALVSVEYRLAPETVFPGAIEDAYAGLAWCFANAEREGFDTARVGVMGESAGGGFAAALALLARDRGEYSLAFQHLIYPMLDDRTGVTSEPHDYAGEFVWPAANNRFGWGALLGRAPGGDDVSAYAAAARATDLAGLPPAYIHTGALDLFVEENMEYARRLIRAGVPTELHVYPGAIHGFELAGSSAVGELAMQASRSALKRFTAATE